MNQTPSQPLLGQQIPGKQSLTELIGNPRRPMMQTAQYTGEFMQNLSPERRTALEQRMSVPGLTQPMIGQPIPGRAAVPAQPMVGQQPLQSPAMPAQPMMGQPLQPSTPMPNGSPGGPMFQQLPRAVQRQLAKAERRAERKERRLTGLGKYPGSNSQYMGGSPNFNEQTGSYQA